jgi:acyl carrier protein
MSDQTTEERELAELLIEVLNFEDLSAEDILPEDPLFADGLGLDSIDALEIAMAISQKFNVQLQAEDERNEEIFFSLRTLNNFIKENRGS